MKDILNTGQNKDNIEVIKQKMTKEERHEIRRKEIMEVTRKCVLQKGFHATSVATIAEEAGINVGQLYRYFDSKEAIIETLIMDTLKQHSQLSLHSIEDMLKIEQSKDNHRLAMEVYVESYRNPKIDKLRQKADEYMTARWIKQMAILYPELSAEQHRLYTDLLSMLFFGMTFHSMDKPEETHELVALAKKMFYAVAKMKD